MMQAFYAFAFAVLSAVVSAPARAQQPPDCPRAVLPAYAHNDYANARPLTDALALGYRGVEADVFLVDGELRLGHDRRSARAGGSFETSYVAPLEALVARCGTLTADTTPFLLAVELKESSPPTYAALTTLLGRYPGLARGVEVVLVGWHPVVDTLRAASFTFGRQYRLRQAAPPNDVSLDEGVRLLSLDYGKTAGRWWVRRAGRERWLEALGATRAANPGRHLRVHNAPVDSAVYRRLLDAGVDLIGTKDILATARILRQISPH